MKENATMNHSTLQQQVRRLFETHGQPVMESVLAGWYLNEASNGSQVDENAISKALALHREETYFQLAEQSKNKRNYAEATQYYLNAYSANPKNTDRKIYIGEYLLRYASQDEILNYYSHLHKTDKADTIAKYVVACYKYFSHLKDELEGKVVGTPIARNGVDPLIMHLAFWGERYADILLNFFLPALAARGNLPALHEKYNIHFIFSTDKDGAERLTTHPMFNFIKRFVSPQIVVFPKPFIDYISLYSKIQGGGWTLPGVLLTNASYLSVIELGRRLNCNVVNLCPDHVFPNQFMTKMDQLLQQRPHVIAGPGYRLLYENSILHEIESKFRNIDGNIDITAKDMVQMLLRYLPEPNYVDSDTFANFPLYLCWRVPGEGIIAHVNHFHPWVINGRSLKGPIELSIDPIDGHFLYRNLKDTDNIVFAPNEMMAFDLGNNPLSLSVTKNAFDPQTIANWLRPHITPTHQSYFLHPYIYRCDENEPSEIFNQTAFKAMQVVKEIISYAD